MTDDHGMSSGPGAPDDGATSHAPTAALTVPVREDDHAVGPGHAAVTLVLYGDYECPYTRRAHHVLRGLLRRHSDAIRLVYRHFPLRTIHPHAQHAAEAAEAAAAQGSFWQMHDRLFANQHALEDTDLEGYADGLGLDGDRFREDTRGHRHARRIRDDFSGGLASGVKGTPTLFLDGARHDGAIELELLSRLVGDAAAARDADRG